MSQSELACVYAALILHDDGLEISADKIQKLTAAANVKVEPYWPGLFAKLFANKSMDDLITNVGAGGGGAISSGGGGGGGAAAEAGGAADKEEEKKDEPEEESDEDMGFSLFD